MVRHSKEQREKLEKAEVKIEQFLTKFSPVPVTIENAFIHLMAFSTGAALDEDLGLTQEEYFGMLIASTFMERVSNKIRRVGDDNE